MNIYIFACNNETFSECITENLFGVAKPYPKTIKIGDYCLLYNYSDKKVYGLWKAVSECGIHKPKAWGGKFKFQVKVNRVSKTLNSIPFLKLNSLLIVNGAIPWTYFGDKAQVLIQFFASEYAAKIEYGKIVQTYEIDYRKKYPAEYHCTDGHPVRSQSEQTIDNWLYHNNIVHAYEPITSIPEQLIPDFQVQSKTGEAVFVEFWGMVDDPAYKERMVKKVQLYSKYAMNLIELRPPDLQNLDFVMKNRLRAKNVL